MRSWIIKALYKSVTVSAALPNDHYDESDNQNTSTHRSTDNQCKMWTVCVEQRRTYKFNTNSFTTFVINQRLSALFNDRKPCSPTWGQYHRRYPVASQGFGGSGQTRRARSASLYWGLWVANMESVGSKPLLLTIFILNYQLDMLLMKLGGRH